MQLQTWCLQFVALATVAFTAAWVAYGFAARAEAEQPSFEIHHRPEVASDAMNLGGAQSAKLRSDPHVFPFQAENEEELGENFEVDISDSEFCSQIKFLNDSITGIVYPRYYTYLSVKAALEFEAARVAGNQRARGKTNPAAVAETVEKEAARISRLLPKEDDKLLSVDVGQNDHTQVYFYARDGAGTMTISCIEDSIYKRCSSYGNLEELGFAVSIHKSILQRPNSLSCYFRAFEAVAKFTTLN